MKLNRFVLRREKTWRQLHTVLAKVEAGGLKRLAEPEVADLIKLYRQASSDLNYLQTHFRESRYTAYLNNLLSRCHTYIHVGEGRFLPRLKHFFAGGFPALLRREKSLFFLATAIFILAFCFAYFSIAREAPWAGEILDPGTRANLEESAASMEEGVAIPAAFQPLFAGYIVTNNIQVAFLAFAGGIICGLGTVYVLLVNGFMLGAYAAVFALQERSLLFWAHILPHGIMELTAIFISAAAGLAVGRALLMPGDYSRKDALRQGSHSAVLLLGGTIPLFVFAAAIEGSVTPAGLSASLKLAFSGLTAAALACYFLPRWGEKHGRSRRHRQTD